MCLYSHNEIIAFNIENANTVMFRLLQTLKNRVYFSSSFFFSEVYLIIFLLELFLINICFNTLCVDLFEKESSHHTVTQLVSRREFQTLIDYYSPATFFLTNITLFLLPVRFKDYFYKSYINQVITSPYSYIQTKNPLPQCVFFSFFL